MITPPIFAAAYYVLTTISTPGALFCLIMAGLQIRREGGINIDTSGNFAKWLLWSCIFLTLAQIQQWLSLNLGLTISASFGNSSASYATPIVQGVTTFVNSVMRDAFVPVAAGALVVKAVLDNAEGRNPLGSIVSAMFLLGVVGMFTTLQGWQDGTSTATVDLLQSFLSWVMTNVSPVAGTICILSAIVQNLRGERWGHLATSGAAFFVIVSIWTLVKSWVGVTI